MVAKGPFDVCGAWMDSPEDRGRCEVAEHFEPMDETEDGARQSEGGTRSEGR